MKTTRILKDAVDSLTGDTTKESLHRMDLRHGLEEAARLYYPCEVDYDALMDEQARQWLYRLKPSLGMPVFEALSAEDQRAICEATLGVGFGGNGDALWQRTDALADGWNLVALIDCGQLPRGCFPVPTSGFLSFEVHSSWEDDALALHGKCRLSMSAERPDTDEAQGKAWGVNEYALSDEQMDQLRAAMEDNRSEDYGWGWEDVGAVIQAAMWDVDGAPGSSVQMFGVLPSSQSNPVHQIAPYGFHEMDPELQAAVTQLGKIAVARGWVKDDLHVRTGAGRDAVRAIVKNEIAHQLPVLRVGDSGNIGWGDGGELSTFAPAWDWAELRTDRTTTVMQCS